MSSKPILNAEINWRRYKRGSLLDSGLALNGTATFILELCNGQHDLQDIIGRVVSLYQVDQAVAARDVQDLLDLLAENRVIHWS